MDTLADGVAEDRAQGPGPDRANDHADKVVLLGEDGRLIGTAPRGSVHTINTPLHLAFSCYLLDGTNRVLLTRRSVGKPTSPGVWTNSFCGHPRPDEDSPIRFDDAPRCSSEPGTATCLPTRARWRNRAG